MQIVHIICGRSWVIRGRRQLDAQANALIRLFVDPSLRRPDGTGTDRIVGTPHAPHPNKILIPPPPAGKSRRLRDVGSTSITRHRSRWRRGPFSARYWPKPATRRPKTSQPKVTGAICATRHLKKWATPMITAPTSDYQPHEFWISVLGHS